MITISTSPVTTEREPIFSIDGTEYTIPREVPGSLALQAMERTRTNGEVSATAWLMEEMLGADGYRALRECPTVRRDEVQAITRIIRDRVFGDLEEEGKG